MLMGLKNSFLPLGEMVGDSRKRAQFWEFTFWLWWGHAMWTWASLIPFPSLGLLAMQCTTGSEPGSQSRRCRPNAIARLSQQSRSSSHLWSVLPPDNSNWLTWLVVTPIDGTCVLYSLSQSPSQPTGLHPIYSLTSSTCPAGTCVWHPGLVSTDIQWWGSNMQWLYIQLPKEVLAHLTAKVYILHSQFQVLERTG